MKLCTQFYDRRHGSWKNMARGSKNEIRNFHSDLRLSDTPLNETPRSALALFSL